MDLISSAWKHVLRTETSQKFLLKNFCYNNKGTKKVKVFRKLSNKEIYSPFSLIVLNIRNLSNSFHGQTSLKEYFQS